MGQQQNIIVPKTRQAFLTGDIKSDGLYSFMQKVAGNLLTGIFTSATLTAQFPPAGNPNKIAYTSDLGWVTSGSGAAWVAIATLGATPGSATSVIARSGGNLNIQTSTAGVGNSADTTDDVLFTYALPANSLDAAGRQVNIVAAGKFAANGNNKRIKIWWGTTTQTVGAAVAGGTLIADSGVQTTNGGGWTASSQVTKYGALGSNTQIAASSQIVAGTAHLGTSAPALLTNAENAAINITITASSGSSSAGDTLAQLFDISFSN